MKIRQLLLRWKRYVVFAAQYFFWERPRGLDFTMRDLNKEEWGRGIHGYSKTNEKHLKAIFKKLPFKEGLRIIDIGCGKGVVLKEAAKFPFDAIAGIDLIPKLIKTANKNMRILHLDDKILCKEANALEFKNYGNYNVFFFSNPFSGELLECVINKIIEDTASKYKRIYIIYHNPVFREVIESKEGFVLKHKLYDSMKQYDTYVYLLERN